MYVNIVDLLVKKLNHYQLHMRGCAKYKATLKKEKIKMWKFV